MINEIDFGFFIFPLFNPFSCWRLRKKTFTKKEIKFRRAGEREREEEREGVPAAPTHSDTIMSLLYLIKSRDRQTW